MKKTMKTGAFIYNNETYNFEFATSLFAHEKRLFVRSVVNSIIDDNNYDVVLKDLIFDFMIIEMFTNIDTSFIDMKDEDGKTIDPVILIEHFLEETDIADIVKANMEAGLLEELNHAVDLNIQYITGINTNSLSDALANLVNTLNSKVSDIDSDSMMEMAQMFSKLSGDFTVDNVVKAYMDTDIHKNNLKEIEESKM